MNESFRKVENQESNREHAIDTEGRSNWGKKGSQLEEGKGHGDGGLIRTKKSSAHI